MSDDLDRAVDARIDSYRPDAVPSFASIEARKRDRDRRRLAVGAGLFSVVAVTGAVAVLPSLTGSGDRLTPEQAAPGAPRPEATAHSSTPSSTPSPYPYTDCDGLRPGDPLDFTNLVCLPENVTQLRTIDCIDGIYVQLLRPGLGDLEGIVGRTPTWRKAAPADPTHGRTPWAFENCKEHG